MQSGNWAFSSNTWEMGAKGINSELWCWRVELTRYSALNKFVTNAEHCETWCLVCLNFIWSNSTPSDASITDKFQLNTFIGMNRILRTYPRVMVLILWLFPCRRTTGMQKDQKWDGVHRNSEHDSLRLSMSGVDEPIPQLAWDGISYDSSFSGRALPCPQLLP